MFGLPNLPSQPNQGMGSAWNQQATPSSAAMGTTPSSSMGMSGMGGMGSMPMGSSAMGGGMGGMGGGMGAMSSSMPMSSASMMNPAASSMMNPAMQALYQQYALRWAAFQKLAAGQQPSMSMGSMNPMAMQAMMSQPGMMGGMSGMGGMMGDMSGAAATGATGAEGGGGGGSGGIYFKTRMCNKWKEGLCPFPSENCRYAHGEAELRTAADNERLAQGGGLAQLDKRGMINLMKKTRLCQEFMTTSMCRYGDKCTFAHGYHELRTPPSGGAGAVNAMTKPKSSAGMIQGGKDLRKTRLCEKFMMTGMCGYGPGCTFAHGVHDLRGPNDPLPPSLTDKPAPGAAAQTGSVIGPSAPEMYGADMSAYAGVGDDGTGGASVAPMPSVGAKRRPDEAGLGTDANYKRQQLEPEENADTSCHLCSELVQAGRSKVLNGLNALENPKAQQLGVMILATSQRLDQLWSRCTPAAVLGWMSKTQGLTVMDKIELLRTLYFHAHANQPNARTPEGGLGLDSQKYVDRGLPPHCADFVYVCLEGKEGTASMSEYFHMLEVCKQLFGINDENYYAVSTEVASIMMGM